MKTGLALIELMRPRGWALPLVVVLGCLVSLSEGIGIGLLIPLLDSVLGDGSTASDRVLALANDYLPTIEGVSRPVQIGLLMVMLIVLKGVLGYGHMLLTSWIDGRISHGLRERLMRQLLDVSYRYVAERDRARLVNTVMNESWRVGDALRILFAWITSACTVLVFSGLLLMISWQLTLFVLTGVLVTSLVVGLTGRSVRRLGEARLAADQELAERSVEMIYGQRMVRLFGQEDREFARWSAASERARRVFLRISRIAGLTQPLLEVLYLPLFLGCLLLAQHLDIAVPTLLGFLVLLFRLQPHLKWLDQGRLELASFDGAIADVRRLLDRADKPYIVSGETPFAGLEHGIAFRGVGFAYGGEADGGALHDVSFDIARGSVTAIVGVSGAGKSTVANLLFRLYNPQQGRILVDGTPLDALRLADWRQRLAIAGQDSELFNATVADNIAYGRPGASRADVVEAARLAGADGFIGRLADGYDTPVGDLGLRLSGGQRQRIGLARALIRRPDVLILDEATSSLDSLAEEAIREVLERLRGRLTLVVIAHRFSMVCDADRVVVLEQGRVAEDGPPDELLAGSGMFATLHELQMRAPRKRIA